MNEQSRSKELQVANPSQGGLARSTPAAQCGAKVRNHPLAPQPALRPFPNIAKHPNPYRPMLPNDGCGILFTGWKSSIAKQISETSGICGSERTTGPAEGVTGGEPESERLSAPLSCGEMRG